MYAGRVPMLVLMTDDERLADPLAAARRLPKGAMIIVRSRDSKQRAQWAYAMMALARLRGLLVLIANDAALASRCGADGLHLSEAMAREAAHWSALRPNWFISAAAHSLHTAMLSKFVDAIILSPVFETLSHPGRMSMTPARANQIAHDVSVPVYALGGVTASNAVLLRGFAGIAAIAALSP